MYPPGHLGCTLQVIWDGHIPGLFSRATLRIIWAWQLYPPGYLGWAQHSRLFFRATLRVIWAWQFYFYPPGYLGCTSSGLYPPGYLGWAPSHPPGYFDRAILCPLGMTTLRVIWGLTTLWANAPSRLFGPGYPLAWIICRVILGSAASASQLC